MPGKPTTWLALTCSGLLLGGCEGTAPEALSGETAQRSNGETAQGTGPVSFDGSSLRSLYDAAAAEGEVFVMAFDPRDVEWLGPAFREAFPGIDVRVSAALGHLPLVIHDAQSPSPVIDVLLTSLMEARTLADGGHLAYMDWSIFDVPSSHIGLRGHFAYTNNIAYTVAYDERRVGSSAAPSAGGDAQPARVPATWAELLQPEFRGRLSTNPFVMTRVAAGLGLRWGAEEAETYGRTLRDEQELLIRFGDATQYFLDDTRDHTYYLGMVSTVTEQWEAQGLPTGYVVPEPVVMEQQGAAVMAGAPHPAAARLLAGWLASDEGRAIREREAKSADLLPGSDHPLALELQARGSEIIHDTPDNALERAELAATLQPLFTESEAAQETSSLLRWLRGE